MQETLIYQTRIRRKTRQSSWERHSNCQADVTITPRLHEILIWLSQLKYLDTDQVARFFYRAGSRKLAERELRRLYDAEYIARLPIPLTRKWGKSPIQYGATRTLHYLDRKGIAYATRYAGVRTDTWVSSLNTIRQLANIEHQLAVSDYLLTVYTKVMNRGGQFTLLGGGYSHLRVHPDAVFQVKLPEHGAVTQYLLEMDRGTESVEKVKSKIDAYVGLYKSGQFRLGNCRVVLVVGDCRVVKMRLPLIQAEWVQQIVKRCVKLRRWVNEHEDADQFITVMPIFSEVVEKGAYR